VGKLLAQKPKGYDEAAKYLSRRGYRVISLAYKPLSSMADVEAAKDTRSVCEEKLIFAGCVAFTCRVRRDTKLVLQRLKEGGMTVAMVTGDALLTAIHVAKEVDICDSENPSNTSQELVEKNKELRLLLEKRRAEKGTMIANGRGQKKTVKPILILEEDESGDMFWQNYEDDSRGSQYVAKDVPQLAKSHDLAVTGSNLATAYEYDPATKTVLEHFKVFARMTPDAKETVIECLHSVGKLCLMCGDGANDVGASYCHHILSSNSFSFIIFLSTFFLAGGGAETGGCRCCTPFWFWGRQRRQRRGWKREEGTNQWSIRNQPQHDGDIEARYGSCAKRTHVVIESKDKSYRC
jgi:cation-transporting ATPase 13A1